jgi:hypothetical protein
MYKFSPNANHHGFRHGSLTTNVGSIGQVRFNVHCITYGHGLLDSNLTVILGYKPTAGADILGNMWYAAERYP